MINEMLDELCKKHNINIDVFNELLLEKLITNKPIMKLPTKWE